MYIGTNCNSLILLIKKPSFASFFVGHFMDWLISRNGLFYLWYGIFFRLGGVCLGILSCDGRGNLVSDFRRKIGGNNLLLGRSF